MPASVRRTLLELDSTMEEKELAIFEDVWLGGGSEAARAWMLAKELPNLGEALADWVAHHKTEAGEYVRAARAQRAA